MSFYERLSQYKQPGESDYALAKRLNVSFQNLGLWRGGSTPSLSMVARIAKELDVDPGYLAFGSRCCDKAANREGSDIPVQK